jgi:hypothetical protein
LVYFAQLESPHFSPAAEKRVGGKFSATGKLKHLTPVNGKESSDSVGINKILGL